MLKLIAILTGCSLTLAISIQAAENVDPAAAKKPSQKSKVAPKQHNAPRTQIQRTPAQHANKPTSTHTNTVQKQQLRRMAPIQPKTAPMVQSNKVQTTKQQQRQTRQGPTSSVP
ncbi:MAG TPA: hypothetical protein VLO30_05950, partial [Chthoniobacterales bacterium]|nr:hypothetical protein [Chthoniobacterales bacterium]